MLGILLITALTAVQYPTTTSAQSAAPTARDTTKSAVVSRAVFHDTMRQLWEEHILYTRNFIISTAANLPDASQVTQRLLRNQTELGDAIKPYYGEAAGTQLTALLRSHILGAAKVLAVAQGSTPTARVNDANPMYPAPVTATTDPATAVKPAATADTTALNSALAAWRANGDSIATFLSTANARNWPRATLQTAMRMHLDLTLKEATARLRGDWAADIAAFDEVHRHALEMADVLSEGIMKQFPNRFTTKSTAVSSLR